MPDGSLKELQVCHIDFPLPQGDKKGWEGAEYIDKGPEGEFLLGLCEGNHCEVCCSFTVFRTAYLTPGCGHYL